MWVVLLILGLAGAGLVMVITSRYGAGLSGDSVDYLSTADSLLREGRFEDYNGEAYVYWPPLYPALLAGGARASGLDPLAFGRLFNALCHAAIVVLAGLIFRQAYPGSRWMAAFGALAAMVSPTLLRLAANISTDPLFIAEALAFALLGACYLKEDRGGTLLAAALTAGAAGITRWNGMTLIATAGILPLLRAQGDWKRALGRAGWAGGLAAAPLAGWALGRNYRTLGTLFGQRGLGGFSVGANMADSISKMSHWYLPRSLTDILPLGVILLGALAAAAGLLFLARRRPDFSRLLRREHLPWALWCGLYYAFVIYTTNAAEHDIPFDDRYYAPLFVFATLAVVALIEALFYAPARALVRRQGGRGLLQVGMLALAAAWLAFPAYQTYKYTRASLMQGEASYNAYNTAYFHESRLMQFLEGYDFEAEAQLYSNYSPAVYAHLRRQVLRGPHTGLRESKSVEDLLQDYGDWPAEGEAYLIWVLPNDWHNYYTPEELEATAVLREVFGSEDGAVYAVGGESPPTPP